MHRDECPRAKAGDDVFGGWINLDDAPQVFRCAPRSHQEVGNRNNGFAKLTVEEERRYEARMRDVIVPPGSVLLFYERIVHMVMPSTATGTMYRVFLGLRLTDDAEHLFGNDELERVVRDQAVPKIKSGQTPRLWPQAYQNFSRNFAPLTEWSVRTFVPGLVETTVVQSKNTSAWYHNKAFARVPAEMRSLRELGLPMHRRYTEDEARLMTPQRAWTLRTFDDPTTHVRFEGVTPQEWFAYEHTKSMSYAARRPRHNDMSMAIDVP